mmetsp:Transcript_28904/g.35606  ORF Transcript_28904/g.35606 Transcript_28904/m.35606 type:complete len:944 (+) Transcript_28904:120-2951(+)
MADNSSQNWNEVVAEAGSEMAANIRASLSEAFEKFEEGSNESETPSFNSAQDQDADNEAVTTDTTTADCTRNGDRNGVESVGEEIVAEIRASLSKAFDDFDDADSQDELEDAFDSFANSENGNVDVDIDTFPEESADDDIKDGMSECINGSGSGTIPVAISKETENHLDVNNASINNNMPSSNFKPIQVVGIEEAQVTTSNEEGGDDDGNDFGNFEGHDKELLGTIIENELILAENKNKLVNEGDSFETGNTYLAKVEDCAEEDDVFGDFNGADDDDDYIDNFEGGGNEDLIKSKENDTVTTEAQDEVVSEEGIVNKNESAKENSHEVVVENPVKEDEENFGVFNGVDVDDIGNFERAEETGEKSSELENEHIATEDKTKLSDQDDLSKDESMAENRDKVEVENPIKEVEDEFGDFDGDGDDDFGNFEGDDETSEISPETENQHAGIEAQAKLVSEQEDVRKGEFTKENSNDVSVEKSVKDDEDDFGDFNGADDDDFGNFAGAEETNEDEFDAFGDFEVADDANADANSDVGFGDFSGHGIEQVNKKDLINMLSYSEESVYDAFKTFLKTEVTEIPDDSVSVHFDFNAILNKDYFGPSVCRRCKSYVRFLSKICLICGEKVSLSLPLQSNSSIGKGIKESIDKYAEYDRCSIEHIGISNNDIRKQIEPFMVITSTPPNFSKTDDEKVNGKIKNSPALLPEKPGSDEAKTPIKTIVSTSNLNLFETPKYETALNDDDDDFGSFKKADMGGAGDTNAVQLDILQPNPVQPFSEPSSVAIAQPDSIANDFFVNSVQNGIVQSSDSTTSTDNLFDLNNQDISKSSSSDLLNMTLMGFGISTSSKEDAVKTMSPKSAAVANILSKAKEKDAGKLSEGGRDLLKRIFSKSESSTAENIHGSFESGSGGVFPDLTFMQADTLVMPKQFIQGQQQQQSDSIHNDPFFNLMD